MADGDSGSSGIGRCYRSPTGTRTILPLQGERIGIPRVLAVGREREADSHYRCQKSASDADREPCPNHASPRG